MVPGPLCPLHNLCVFAVKKIAAKDAREKMAYCAAGITTVSPAENVRSLANFPPSHENS